MEPSLPSRYDLSEQPLMQSRPRRFSMKMLLGVTTGCSLLGWLGSWAGFAWPVWHVATVVLALPISWVVLQLCIENRLPTVRRRLQRPDTARDDAIFELVLAAYVLCFVWGTAIGVAVVWSVMFGEPTWSSFLLTFVPALFFSWTLVALLGGLLGLLFGALVGAIVSPLLMVLEHGKPQAKRGRTPLLLSIVAVNLGLLTVISSLDGPLPLPAWWLAVLPVVVACLMENYLLGRAKDEIHVGGSREGAEDIEPAVNSAAAKADS